MILQERLLWTLQTELRNFGLNPSEWTLQQLNALHYRVLHRTDDDFSFYGRLEYRDHRPQWKSLEIESL